jgi:hypothetical protein
VQRAEARATGTPGGSVAGSLTPAPPPPPPPPPVASTLNQTIQTSTQQAAVQQTEQRSPQENLGPRPTVTLSGFVGGLMTSFFTGTSSSSQPSTGVAAGTATVALNAATSRVQANFNGGVERPPGSAYLPTEFAYQFGSTDPNLDPQGAYGDYNTFAAGAALDKQGKPLSTINGMAITDQTGAMLVIDRETAKQFAAQSGNPTTNFCDCDYTRWGLWASNSTQGPYNDTAIGFWVAGRPTTAPEVPTTGQATYAGHVIANIDNAGSNYVATGNFSNTVNFGARTGQVTVTGLDNTTYAGQVQFLPDPRNFAGSLAGDVGQRQMGLTGSFYRGALSPVGEMGGAVAISGPGYLGGGIFAAKMK